MSTPHLCGSHTRTHRAAVFLPLSTPAPMLKTGRTYPNTESHFPRDHVPLPQGQKGTHPTTIEMSPWLTPCPLRPDAVRSPVLSERKELQDLTGLYQPQGVGVTSRVTREPAAGQSLCPGAAEPSGLGTGPCGSEQAAASVAGSARPSRAAGAQQPVCAAAPSPTDTQDCREATRHGGAERSAPQGSRTGRTLRPEGQPPACSGASPGPREAPCTEGCPLEPPSTALENHTTRTSL